MALEQLATYITDFTSFMYIPLAIMFIYCLFKAFSGGDKNEGLGGGGGILDKAKDFWSGVVKRKETERGEPEEKAVREAEKEAKGVKKAEKREEISIMNEFLWLEACKKAVKRYYEEDKNLHLGRAGSSAPKLRRELNESVERRDLRRLNKHSQRLMQRLKVLESEADAKGQARIKEWIQDVFIYEDTIIKLMSISPPGEFEKLLTTQIAIVKGTQPIDDKDVKAKYEKLLKILDEALKAVEGLAAVEKQIKAEFGL